MDFKQISDALESALNSNSNGKLVDLLSDTSPGNYGIEDAEFQCSKIWIDIQKGTFRFTDAAISFMALLGSSNPEDGIENKYSKTVSGHGTFKFKGSNDVEILTISTDKQVDLYED